MKNMKRMKNVAGLLILMFTSLAAFGQQSAEEFTIPLSKPGSAGKLIVDLHEGGVTVTGYSGNEVVVSVLPREEEDKDEDREDRSRAGLKRIPNAGMSFEIEEENNVIRIAGSRRRHSDFTIKVPKQFSLSIKTHHDGDVSVKDVSGELVIDAHHGGMELQNVGGSVVADTHHGDIIVSFTSIKSGVPMAFSTYHGDVDISFPSSVNADMKMKTDRGDIYTDFDMELSTSKPTIQKTKEGKQKIAVMEWVRSKMGSGGPEYMFTTHHGDIILRKK